MQPKLDDVDYDLDAALKSIVGIRSMIPDDALTADVLGTERAGNGVLIGNGIVLTVGYLVTEAESIWISLADGTVVPGHALGFDQETGFGFVQLLAKLDLPAMPLGSSKSVKVGENVVVSGHGGRRQAIAARIVAKQEFAGYWEYVLDEAFFTAPAHPHWGGAALIGPEGELLGIGSLQLQQAIDDDEVQDLNMVMPIDLVKPILDEIATSGWPKRTPRPWMGLYATEVSGSIFVAGLAASGPARDADLQPGDMILNVDGEEVSDLAEFFRKVWSLGPAGVQVPMTIHREGETIEVRLRSADRRALLKGPVLH
jgi:S1-C subfamily serine protease